MSRGRANVYAPEFMPRPWPLKACLHMPSTQRRPHQRGSPQKTFVAQKGAKRERHFRFLEGKGDG
eukprot:8374768-Ditylum_brightwellii.AAC.1